MQLAQSFEVSAPIDRVWQALTDIEYVAPCLPGATVTGRDADGRYDGSFTVKIGPTTASYTGKLEMLEVDESQHRAMMHANGTDKRGQGGATATIVSKLTESAAGGTHVEVQTDYKITGRLARFGRGGMIEDISERLLRQFAERLAESLTAAPAVDGAAVETAPAASPEGEADVQAPITGAHNGAAGSAEASASDEEAQAAKEAPAAPQPLRTPLPPVEPPDMGKIATQALLARISEWAPFAGVALVIGYILGRRRGRRS
jgi:carbon monoxide dehydrogenase subunit G